MTSPIQPLSPEELLQIEKYLRQFVPIYGDDTFEVALEKFGEEIGGVQELKRLLKSELYWRSAVMNEAESSDFHSGCVHCYAVDSDAHKPDCPYLLAQGYK